MFGKFLTVTLVSLAAATPALATETLGGGGCSSDLSIGAGSSLIDCYGRFSGNSLNNTSNADINTALTALGYTGPAITYSSIASANILSGLSGLQTIDFPGLLSGTVYVGIHYGGGMGGPGNSTTFYAISASNLDTFKLNLRASSTATLLATVAAPVPETATWMMMVAGFGILGGAMRRQQRAAVRFS